MRAQAVALALGLSLAASLAEAAQTRSKRKEEAEAQQPAAQAQQKVAAPADPKERREGKVVQVTPARIYLDAGASEGVAAGQKLHLRRGAGSAGSCVVDHVGDHRASCTGAAARVGDTFALTPPPPLPGKAPLPKPLPVAELNRERQVLQSAATAPVEYGGLADAAGRVPLRASATLSHRSWLSSEASAWHDERVDVRLGAPIGGAGYFDLDATAVHLTRPGADRFRPDTPNQLYVWRAELALRPSSAGAGFSGSLGRLIPASAPGAPRIDGAQVALRLDRGEVGLFGGGIPDAQTLAPGFDRQTAGLFFSLGRTGDHEGAVSYSQATARVAYVKAPEWGTRFEAELSALAQLYRTLDLSASARLATGDNASPALVDAARVGFDLRPSGPFRLSGALRFVGSKLPSDAVGLGNGLILEGQSRHGDLNATYQLSPGAILGVEGGLARDVTSATTRGWAGPTLLLPQFFGGAGGLAFGYHEELGDQPGRSAWAQTTLLPSRSVQVTARLSVLMDSRANGGFDDLEAGLYLRLQARLTDHVSFHLSGMGRLQPVAAQVVPSPLPYGVWIDAGIAGDL